MRLTEYEIRGAAELTIAVVADLHEHNPAPALEILRAVQPDVITVPGDLMERELDSPADKNRPDHHGLLLRSLYAGTGLLYRLAKAGGSGEAKPEYSFEFLRAAAEIAPVLMSQGNHEHCLTEEDRALLRETGTIFLHNSAATVCGVHFAGVPSRRGGGTVDPAFLRDFAARDGYKVLLCHHPEYYEEVREYGSLILSGHCHGGQIRLHGRGLYAPGQGFLPQYTHGLYGGDRIGSATMVVSAGCANTTLIPRLGNPTEVVIVRITPDIRQP